MTAEPSPRQHPQPQGAYQLVVTDGRIAVTAGMTPRVDGELFAVGHVGSEVTIEVAGECAQIAVGNALTALRTELGDLNAITQCLRMTVFVACGADFTAHSRVADYASEALIDELGARGRVVRSAVGVSSLPGGAPVEIELTVAVSE